MNKMQELAFETAVLTKRFGRKLALRDLTLRVPRGGVHAVVGANGAGKSTLFRILLGLMSPTSGSSRALGHESQALPPEVRGRIGLVNEEHSLPGWMKVQAIKAMHRDLYPKWDDAVFQEVVGHFHVLPEQKISQLSRGERAGLNLAMALAQRPELLILDEPTLGIDVVARQAFLESVLFVGEDPESTIVYCSHQMDEIERVADNLILLERGSLMSMAPPDEFCSRISYWVADFLAGMPQSTPVPGLLQRRQIDGQQHLVVLDQDDSFAEWITSSGGSGAHRLPIGLDRAVNAYLDRNHAAPGA